MRPTDICEEIWVRDFVHHDWDVVRLRRLKASLLTANAYKGLDIVLEPLLTKGAGKLPEQWARKKPSAVERVDRILASAGLTKDAVLAAALCGSERGLGSEGCITVVERIEHLMAKSESRRDATMHEIERHRATFANKPRRAAQQIVDGEFEEIEPPSAEGSRAA
ncbi:MAG TPA: hypothetical protein VGG61_05120 [Gemmataceae bacterium]